MAPAARAQLAFRKPVGGALWLVGLTVDAPLLQAFHAPGQYQSLRVGEGFEAVFALASAPGTAPLELLVRAKGGVAEALLALPVGAALSVGPPQGPGFPLERARGRPLLLVGTGAGLGPLRSVLAKVLAEPGHSGPVTLVWGVRDESEAALGGEVARWEAAGVTVHVTVSAPSGAWRGRTGRVLRHLPAVAPGTLVFVCGQAELLGDVRAALAPLGVPPGDVHANV